MSDWFRRYLLPGFVFEAAVIAGGYATGRELVEFFLPAGPWGGLLGMLVSMLFWSAVLMISFELAGVHPHDIAQVLDSRGIAIRAGHHCAKPAHARFGVQSSSRMSSYLYTTPAEIDALVEGLHHTRSYFKVDR